MVNVDDSFEEPRAWVDTAGFRAVAEGLDQCAALFDAQGRCRAVNRLFCDWLDRPEAAVVGRTIAELWPRPLADKEAADLTRVLAEERIEQDEQRPRARQLMPVRAVKAPVRDLQGRVRAVLVLFRDVSAEHDRAEVLCRAARLESLGRLTGGIVHDFNNLLTVLTAHLELLRQGPTSGEWQGHLDAMDYAIHQAADLSRQLLAFARSDTTGAQPVDVNQAAQRIAAVLRRTMRGVEVLLALRPGLPAVLAEPGQITQVLLNLCLNACDAMPRGGQITIETEGPTPAAPACVCLRVRDNGAGMPPEVRERIFEPFFSTKLPGRNSGLGLTVVREVVDHVGGRIECTSAPGAGTCFTLWLPAAVTVAPAQPQAPASVPTIGQGAVLLADEDPAVRRLARAVLEQAGYRVLEAADSAEAAELCHQGSRIDLVILEQHGRGPSGDEMTEQLHRLAPDLRVLLTSGCPEPVPPGTSDRPGLLAKPYTPAQLLGAVAAALA